MNCLLLDNAMQSYVKLQYLLSSCFIEFLTLPDNSFIVKPGVIFTLPCSAVVGSDVLEWFYTENESHHSIWNSQNKSVSEPGSVSKLLSSSAVVDAVNSPYAVDNVMLHLTYFSY